MREVKVLAFSEGERCHLASINLSNEEVDIPGGVVTEDRVCLRLSATGRSQSLVHGNVKC